MPVVVVAVKPQQPTIFLQIKCVGGNKTILQNLAATKKGLGTEDFFSLGSKLPALVT